MTIQDIENARNADELYDAGYEMFCEAAEWPRGIDEVTERLSKITKKLVFFVTYPYLLLSMVRVFFACLMRGEFMKAPGMTVIWLRFKMRHLEERGWIEIN